MQATGTSARVGATRGPRRNAAASGPRARRSPSAASAAPAGATPVYEEHLLERLAHLRTVVPALAEELASARRSAAQLRRENHRLIERIRELQSSRRGRR